MKTTILSAGLLTAASWAYLRNIQLPIGPSRRDWGPLVIGHRGCRNITGVPENTIEAIDYARKNGAQGVEVDIRLTRDDQLVVFHDAVLGNIMVGRDAKQRIDELDLMDVKSLVFSEDPTREVRIPTAEEVILYCRDNNLRLLIEIKEFQRPTICVDKLLELFRRYPEYMYNETLVIAFSPFVLYNIRKRDRKVAVGMLHSGVVLQTLVERKIDKYPFIIGLCPAFFDRILNFGQTALAPWIIGVSAMCPRYLLCSEAYKRLWFKRGMALYVWGFENSQQCPAYMRGERITIGVDDLYHEYIPAKKEVSYQTVFPDAPSNYQAQLPPSGAAQPPHQQQPPQQPSQ